VLVNPSKEANISYAGSSPRDFENAMVELDRSLRAQGSSGYAGLIFEDYRGMHTIVGS
jgi:hypothetical protein